MLLQEIDGIYITYFEINTFLHVPESCFTGVARIYGHQYEVLDSLVAQQSLLIIVNGISWLFGSEMFAGLKETDALWQVR